MEIGTGGLDFVPEIQVGQVSPSSVDLRLGNEFTTFPPPTPGIETVIDLTRIGNPERVAETYGNRTILANDESFVLHPGQFVLTYTQEYLRLPNYLAARVEGRSSLARLGISIHQTAPTVHATFEGKLRLEISHNGPYACRLYPGQRICQLIIERLSSPSQSSLNSPFQRQGQI